MSRLKTFFTPYSVIKELREGINAKDKDVIEINTQLMKVEKDNRFLLERYMVVMDESDKTIKTLNARIEGFDYKLLEKQELDDEFEQLKINIRAANENNRAVMIEVALEFGAVLSTISDNIDCMHSEFKDTLSPMGVCVDELRNSVDEINFLVCILKSMAMTHEGIVNNAKK